MTDEYGLREPGEGRVCSPEDRCRYEVLLGTPRSVGSLMGTGQDADVVDVNVGTRLRADPVAGLDPVASRRLQQAPVATAGDDFPAYVSGYRPAGNRDEIKLAAACCVDEDVRSDFGDDPKTVQQCRDRRVSGLGRMGCDLCHMSTMVKSEWLSQ